MDSDLVSIQEARDLAVAAFDAQKIWAKATQEAGRSRLRSHGGSRFSGFRATWAAGI